MPKARVYVTIIQSVYGSMRLSSRHAKIQLREFPLRQIGR